VDKICEFVLYKFDVAAAVMKDDEILEPDELTLELHESFNQYFNLSDC